MDLLAIADAVADAYGALATPADETVGIQGATARTPNNVPSTPYVVVELPSGDVALGGGQRQGTHNFEVYFLLDRASGDIPRDKLRLLRWLPSLLDATYSAMKLGIAIVSKSYVVSYEYGIYDYGGTEYHAWHLTVRVWTADSVTLTP